jgi:catechol 2,3-dioxygenase-like lactoylglutathione lyase family enzyme
MKISKHLLLDLYQKLVDHHFVIDEDTSQSNPAASTALPLKVVRVDHAGIMVRNLDPVIDWYVRVLNASVIDRWKDADAGMAWAHLDIASFRIEFVQMPDLDEGESLTLGLHHIAVVVSDCAVVADALVDAGGEMVLPPSYFERHDMDWAFVRDPFGNILEVVSYRDGPK